MTTQKIMISSRAQSRKKGFTLTELAIVLGIIGLILGAIWTAATSVYASQHVGRANAAVLQIMQGARALYAPAPNTGVTAATDITPTMVAANVIPVDLVNGGPWSGSTIKVTTPSTADSFTIELDNIPQYGCVGLLQTIGGNSRDPGLFAVASTSAGGNSITTGVTGTPLNTKAGTVNVVNSQAAMAACSAAGNTNFVQFGFSLK